jgi:hypothetical protein
VPRMPLKESHRLCRAEEGRSILFQVVGAGSPNHTGASTLKLLALSLELCQCKGTAKFGGPSRTKDDSHHSAVAQLDSESARSTRQIAHESKLANDRAFLWSFWCRTTARQTPCEFQTQFIVMGEGVGAQDHRQGETTSFGFGFAAQRLVPMPGARDDYS